MKIKIDTKNIVLTSLFAALICISIGFLFRIQTGFNSGYIHLGDVIIYLAAAMLPTHYAILAVAIGGGIADALTGGILWIIPTIIIKSGMVLYFTSKSKTILCKRNIIGIILAGITGWIGYYIAGGIIAGNFISALAMLPLEGLQPLASGIVFLMIGRYFDKIGIKKKLLK
ncbi:TIGR04002 family protein [Clostridium sp.]|uniref:TIGR04002 family protein n=1 Tax=Clostridium sp. TaxID=1506 RepID=UPI002630F6D8|nr:TIGR04002 family protein [Clostridium sp.]